MLISNEFSSAIIVDILAYESIKQRDAFVHKPKHVIVGHAQAILRQWDQWKIIDLTNQTDIDHELTSPHLPILTVFPSDLQPDQSPFAWHRVNLPSFQKRYTSFCVYKDDTIAIKYVPYLYTLRFNSSFVGRSYLEITDCKVAIEELYATRQMVEEEIDTALVIPPGILETYLAPEQLDAIKSVIPYETVRFIGEERFIIPFKMRYFIRCNGQSDNSQLFGDQQLPSYMVSYDFEVFVSLPTKLIIDFNPGVIKTIDIKSTDITFTSTSLSSTKSNVNDYSIIETTSIDYDDNLKSYVLHTILSGESE
jgi:hypothetical protein